MTGQRKKDSKCCGLGRAGWALLLLLLAALSYLGLSLRLSRSWVSQPGLRALPAEPAVVEASRVGPSATVSTPSRPKKIAYAITVTKDGPFLDGALVLGYGVMKLHGSSGHPLYAQIPTPPSSQYEAELIAFVTPQIKVARHVLQAFGWTVLERPLPVTLDEIENKNYVERMKNSGCCGADEFLKLWAYALDPQVYLRVIHLDMDSVVFGSMDEIMNADQELLYTGDYNMQGRSPVPPVQGEF
jgi:hypothetical protein